MKTPELKKFLQDRGIRVNSYLNPGLVAIACAVEEMDYHHNQCQTTEAEEKLNMHMYGWLFVSKWVLIKILCVELVMPANETGSSLVRRYMRVSYANISVFCTHIYACFVPPYICVFSKSAYICSPKIRIYTRPKDTYIYIHTLKIYIRLEPMYHEPILKQIANHTCTC